MTVEHSYDLVILGGGAASFAAITEADRRGLSTAMVNTGLPLGGTCVNVGCVPSKHLLEVGKTAFEPPRNPFDAVGYGIDEPSVDWARAMDEKDRIVSSLRERNYVDVAERFGTDVYEGRGRFVDGATIEVVDGPDVGATITGERALVATGSSPRVPSIDSIDDVPFETSESILERRDRPERVVVLGGGYVATEWGQILHHLGSDVTILQRSGHVLSGLEPQLGRELQRCLEDEDITVVTDVHVRRVAEIEPAADGGEPTGSRRGSSEPGSDGGVDIVGRDVVVEADVDGEPREYSATDLFVATGVRPNTDGIGLDAIGVETDDSGAVVVDEELRTAHADVYAAGDCVGEPMLETVAAKAGNHAVRHAFGDEGATIDYHSVPTVVFTSPEVAAVGTTEAEYVAEHGTCTCRTIDVADVPKARVVEDTRGLVQVVKHHETDAVVGVHMVGPRAADVIPEATLAVKFGLTVDDVIDTVHPFPTFSEAFKHACQAFRRDVSRMSCCIE